MSVIKIHHDPLATSFLSSWYLECWLTVTAYWDRTEPSFNLLLIPNYVCRDKSLWDSLKLYYVTMLISSTKTVMKSICCHFLLRNKHVVDVNSFVLTLADNLVACL